MTARLVLAAAAFAAVVSGCTAHIGCGKCAKSEVSRWQKNILLPEKIYAVPGIECNIYFKNVFLAVNHDNFIFDVECDAGTNFKSRWSYIPSAADAGKTIPLKLNVIDQYGEPAACASTTVCVANPDSGKGKEITILMIGDSLTDATEYPRQLKRLCDASSPRLKMIGTNGGRGKTPAEGVVHEGYSGWQYWHFFNRYTDESKLEPRSRYAAKSKFLTSKDGKTELDFEQFFQKYNGGKAPDVITIQLGVNDIYQASVSNIDEYIKTYLDNAGKFISAIRRAAPDTLIGIGYVTGCSGQDGFGTNYKNRGNAWIFYHNHFKLNQAIAQHFKNYADSKVVLIPVNVNLDTKHNFPVKKVRAAARSAQFVGRQSNGLHPDYYGYRQMADSYYAWLKNVL